MFAPRGHRFPTPQPRMLQRPTTARFEAHGLGVTAPCSASLQPLGLGRYSHGQNPPGLVHPGTLAQLPNSATTRAPETNDGSFRSPWPGLDSAVLGVASASRAGEIQPWPEISRTGPPRHSAHTARCWPACELGVPGISARASRATKANHLNAVCGLS
jgi:hypothetical protein